MVERPLPSHTRAAKIICAAINCVKHSAESDLPISSFPNLFARFASELVFDGTPVPVPVAEPYGLDCGVIEHVRVIDILVTNAGGPLAGGLS